MFTFGAMDSRKKNSIHFKVDDSELQLLKSLSSSKNVSEVLREMIVEKSGDVLKNQDGDKSDRCKERFKPI